MRKAALSLAALAALAAPAMAEVSGSLGVGYANNDYGDFDFDETGVTAALAAPLAGTWSLRGQLAYSEYDFSGGSESQSTVGEAHLLYHGENWRLGALAAGADIFERYHWLFGVEGAAEVEAFTITASYVQDFADLPGDYTMSQGRAAVSYFVNDNFALTGSFSGLQYDQFIFGYGWHDVGLSADYRLGALPIVLSAGVQRFEFDGDNDQDTWRVGLRWDFGAASLRETDRSGAGFDGVANFVRNYYALD